MHLKMKVTWSISEIKHHNPFIGLDKKLTAIFCEKTVTLHGEL